MKEKHRNLGAVILSLKLLACGLLMALSSAMSNGYAAPDSTRTDRMSENEMKQVIEKIKAFVERGQFDVASVEKEFGVQFEKYDSIFNEREFGPRLPKSPTVYREVLIATAARAPFKIHCGGVFPINVDQRTNYFVGAQPNKVDMSIFIDFPSGSHKLFDQVFSDGGIWRREDGRLEHTYSIHHVFKTGTTTTLVREIGGACVGVYIMSIPDFVKKIE